MTTGRRGWRSAGLALLCVVAVPLALGGQTTPARNSAARPRPTRASGPAGCDGGAPLVRIEGTVRDALTELGIPGVRVIIRAAGQTEEELPLARLSTSLAGTYAATLRKCDRYLVIADLENWRFAPLEAPMAGMSSGVVSTGDGDSPYRMDFRGEAGASLALSFVTDAERPLPALQVVPLRRTYLRGQPILSSEAHARTTDDKGLVRFEMLRSGDYAFQVTAGAYPVMPSPPAPSRVTSQEGETREYPFVFQIWPDGALDAGAYAGLISLAPGSDLHLGAIVLRPQQLARLRVVTPPGREGAVSVRVSIGNEAQEVTVAQAGGTGDDYLLPRIPAGRYRMDAYFRGPAVYRVSSEDLEIRAPETTVTPGFQVPSRISVRFEFEGEKDEDAKRLAESVKVLLTPLASEALVPGAENGSTSGAERFPSVTLSTQRKYRAQISGVPPGFVVTEVQSPAGSVSPSQAVSFSGAVLRPELVIVMARTPAALLARVPAETAAKCQPCSVYLMPAEADGLLRYFSTRHQKVEGNRGGTVTFSGLRPGSYWVWALPGPKTETMEQPGALDQILQRAIKVTLEKNQTVSVDAPLSVPN